jgi:hexosaminidase
VFDGTVIQIWKGDVNKTWEMYMNNITKDGYKVILSSPWYLNYIKYGNYLMIIIAIFSKVLPIIIGIDWPDYYKIEPTNFNGNNKFY